MTRSSVGLSIVIPSFNESRRIARTVEELRAALTPIVPDHEIRVVDDGSDDDTALIVERLAREDRHVVLQREPHRGKGAAVRHGMLAAAGDLRFMCDADLSMPVRELTRFLPLVPAVCDIAIGSREAPGSKRVGEPAYRHVRGRVFNALVKRIIRSSINDTQCGFKLFSARAVEAVFPLMTIEGWAFDVEMLVIAESLGLRVQEVPIEWHHRDGSRISALGDPFRMIRDCWTIRRNAARGLYRQRRAGVT